MVLSRDEIHRKLPIAVVAPLSSKLHKGEGNFRYFRVRIPVGHMVNYDLPPASGQQKLTGDSLVLTEQVRVFAHARFIGDPIAKLTIQSLNSIEAGLKFVLHMA